MWKEIGKFMAYLDVILEGKWDDIADIARVEGDGTKILLKDYGDELVSWKGVSWQQQWVNKVLDRIGKKEAVVKGWIGRDEALVVRVNNLGWAIMPLEEYNGGTEIEVMNRIII